MALVRHFDVAGSALTTLDEAEAGVAQLFTFISFPQKKSSTAGIESAPLLLFLIYSSKTLISNCSSQLGPNDE